VGKYPKTFSAPVACPGCVLHITVTVKGPKGSAHHPAPVCVWAQTCMTDSTMLTLVKAAQEKYRAEKALS
jgi:hypothetical protein